MVSDEKWAVFSIPGDAAIRTIHETITVTSDGRRHLVRTIDGVVVYDGTLEPLNVSDGAPLLYNRPA